VGFVNEAAGGAVSDAKAANQGCALGLRLKRHSSMWAQEPSSLRSSLTKPNSSALDLVQVMRQSRVSPIIVMSPRKTI